MFHRLRIPKHSITPEMIKRKEEAERLQKVAKQELSEARDIGQVLREIREKNHFSEGFRKSLGGTSGH